MLKSVLFVLAACGMSFSATAQLADPVLVPASFGKIYFPNGYDSNDHVQIVGEGVFRDSCYRPAPAEVKVDEVHKTVMISPAAYEYQGVYCLQYLVRYDRTLDIGILKTGTWKISQGNPATPLGEITIKAATTDAPDDYLYAPVSQAFFHQIASTKEVLMTGEFTNDCMSIDRVITAIEKEAIVLQPIAKVDTRPNCQEGKFPFTQTVDMSKVPAGRFLLHVRSMNGNAINTLVDVL